MAGRREQLIGLLVVVAIAAGAYFTTTRNEAVPTVCTLGSAPGAQTDLHNISLADARLGGDGVAVLIEVPSRPILAFEENLLLFRFEEESGSAGTPLAVTDATVSFNMRMEMGESRYTLVPADRTGWLAVRFVLPACPSGSRRWYGILSFTAGGWPRERRFEFDLQPGADATPGTAAGQP